MEREVSMFKQYIIYFIGLINLFICGNLINICVKVL